jgi:hypothetical protein
MTQDVACHQNQKTGRWAFKALTPRARTKFLEMLKMPPDFDGDVFITNVTTAQYQAVMRVCADAGLNTDKSEPVKVDTKRYTDF